jgi:hypothetical protein
VDLGLGGADVSPWLGGVLLVLAVVILVLLALSNCVRSSPSSLSLKASP